MRLRFADFTLDSETRELLRGDESLHLSPKAFELLLKLIEARPRALAKQEILEMIWPGTFVSESTLAAVVTELRSVLGDDARKPRFLRTIQRFGYAFRGEVERETRSGSRTPAFRLVWADREIALAEGENILGRSEDAVAWIDDPSISRHHAVIHVSGKDASVEDLDSKNGTFLKGTRIHGRHPLNDGDRLMFGKVAMVFRMFRDQTTASIAPT